MMPTKIRLLSKDTCYCVQQPFFSQINSCRDTYGQSIEQLGAKTNIDQKQNQQYPVFDTNSVNQEDGRGSVVQLTLGR